MDFTADCINGQGNNMTIQGLGSNKKPFIYLDEYITDVDWEQLHSDVCFGISQSQWNKKFVSSGVHDHWADQEITPYMRQVESLLTSYELDSYNKCKTIDEKLKFITALKHIPHPFWSIFIRNNKRIESTGLLNKHISSDCEWLENAKYFPSLISLINVMPFESIGRVMLFMTEANNQTLPHYDGRSQNDRPNDDFIWFTTKQTTKQIYVMDSESLVKTHADPSKRFIWFNEMDYHGTDITSHFSFSIRIDGKFKPNIRNELFD